MNVMEIAVGLCGLDSSVSEQRPVAECCKRGNEVRIVLSR
jgi:hypothetical protein